MKHFITRVPIQTHHETELINITDTVRSEIEKSGVRSGTVFILSLHTTTALTVNEGLPDLEADIAEYIQRLVPEEYIYRHARFLHSDGQMAINAPSHLRGALLGFEAFFPIDQGEMLCGGRQTIYFVELDGPQERTYVIQIIGV
ncbi:YjbQ family protein [candidate division KSB3 bacterium]|uniref:YjbQ family protein n=1 Tax=candidate division KSB3 bacterium TaxID=2044937 RepID=A0A9D5JZN4_9BACT|nr:YjbQ family protein [candidate division KSB3 bacterium]MBD3327169.1 YjbQ family protein [candidate division KSB3 bacterium]